MNRIEIIDDVIVIDDGDPMDIHDESNDVIFIDELSPKRKRIKIDDDEVIIIKENSFVNFNQQDSESPLSSLSSCISSLDSPTSSLSSLASNSKSETLEFEEIETGYVQKPLILDKNEVSQPQPPEQQQSQPQPQFEKTKSKFIINEYGHNSKEEVLLASKDLRESKEMDLNHTQTESEKVQDNNEEKMKEKDINTEKDRSQSQEKDDNMDISESNQNIEDRETIEKKRQKEKEKEKEKEKDKDKDKEKEKDKESKVLIDSKNFIAVKDGKYEKFKDHITEIIVLIPPYIEKSQDDD